MIVRWIRVLSLVLPLGSCTASGDQDVANAAVTQCTEPRPQFCTTDYRPVCAILADGLREKFSNGCGACTNPEVTSWTAGACPNQN